VPPQETHGQLNLVIGRPLFWGPAAVNRTAKDARDPGRIGVRPAIDNTPCSTAGEAVYGVASGRVIGDERVGLSCPDEMPLADAVGERNKTGMPLRVGRPPVNNSGSA
jgi:hypothetical protein